tara:strand:- start:825 stop:2204 length:1380 start_codon:yes stop_codon:yes gene_type:complete
MASIEEGTGGQSARHAEGNPAGGGRLTELMETLRGATTGLNIPDVKQNLETLTKVVIFVMKRLRYIILAAAQELIVPHLRKFGSAAAVTSALLLIVSKKFPHRVPVLKYVVGFVLKQIRLVLKVTRSSVELIAWMLITSICVMAVLLSRDDSGHTVEDHLKNFIKHLWGMGPDETAAKQQKLDDLPKDSSDEQVQEEVQEAKETLEKAKMLETIYNLMDITVIIARPFVGVTDSRFMKTVKGADGADELVVNEPVLKTYFADRLKSIFEYMQPKVIESLTAESSSSDRASITGVLADAGREELQPVAVAIGVGVASENMRKAQGLIPWGIWGALEKALHAAYEQLKKSNATLRSSMRARDTPARLYGVAPFALATHDGHLLLAPDQRIPCDTPLYTDAPMPVGGRSAPYRVVATFRSGHRALRTVGAPRSAGRRLRGRHVLVLGRDGVLSVNGTALYGR